MHNILRSISLAHLLKERYAQVLLNSGVLPLLENLDRCIEASQNSMISAGVVTECADCALNEEGTCCGLRTGNKYDSLILLVNLLLGRSLPEKAQFPDRCYFLTDKGCALKARHVICVNFVCQRLRNSIPIAALIRLQAIAGVEIHTLFLLEENIKKIIGHEIAAIKKQERHDLQIRI